MCREEKQGATDLPSGDGNGTHSGKGMMAGTVSPHAYATYIIGSNVYTSLSLVQSSLLLLLLSKLARGNKLALELLDALFRQLL